MKKRLFALLLAACLALGLLPVTVLATDGLVVVEPGFNNGKLVVGDNTAEQSSLTIAANDMKPIRLILKGTQDAEVTENVTSSNEKIVSIQKAGEADVGDPNHTFWFLRSLSLGTATIEYSDGTSSYSLPVTVTLPEEGFYTATEPSTANFCAEVDFAKLPENDKSIYLLSENGYTQEEANGITVYKVIWNNETHTENKTPLTAAPVSLQNNKYALKVTLVDPGNTGYTVRAERTVTNGDNTWTKYINTQVFPVPPSPPGPGGDTDVPHAKLAQVTINNKTYYLGFGFPRADGVLDLYDENMTGPGTSYELNEDGSYQESFNFNLYLAEKKDTQGENSIYEQTNASQSVNWSVKSISLVPSSGNEQTFSLAQDKWVKTANASDDSALSKSFPVYYSRQYAGRVIVTAEIMVAGQEDPVTVTCPLTCESVIIDTIDCAALNLGNAAALNQYLSAREPTEHQVELILDAKSYTDETVVIPALSTMFEPRAVRIIGQSGTVVGNMRVTATGNSGIWVENVEYQSGGSRVGVGITSLADTPAISLNNCTFDGYATAVDSTAGFIAPTHGNTFQNNGVAVLMAVRENGINQDQWVANCFLNNDTAVKVTKLNGFLTPYYFRLRDSDFIGNTVDLDFSQSHDVYLPGSKKADFYMYRNFFGATAGKWRNPKTIEGKKVHLYCHPAAKEPRVYGKPHQFDPKDTWLPNNALLGSNNTILNDEAADLTVGQDQLLGNTIDVVQDAGQGAEEIGRWDFPNEKMEQAALETQEFTMRNDRLLDDPNPAPAGFNAGLEISNVVDKSFTVTISEGNTPILSSNDIHAILVIPCPAGWSNAQVTGPDNSVVAGATFDSEKNEVSFTVEMGGKYTIKTEIPYTITVVNGTSDKATAVAGDSVSITANAEHDGQVFDKWTSDDVVFSDANATQTSFNMPAKNVTIVANYKEKPSPVPSGGGVAPVTNVITVPVSGDENTVVVSAKVSGDTATIQKSSGKELERVIGEGVETGDITIDVSGMGKEVHKVAVPTEMVKAINEAVNDPENDANSLTIKLTDGNVTFDGAALTAITEEAKGNNITVGLDNVGEKGLNTVQKAAVADMQALAVYDAYVMSGNARISDFKGGKATVSVGYTLKESQNARGLVGWYVAEDGTKAEITITYENGFVIFEVAHFSNYVLSYDEERAAKPVNPFEDVAETDPYYDAVLWAYYHEPDQITNGRDETHFDPDGIVKRGEAVTFLWRAEGCPEPESLETPFDDLTEDYYMKAVAWAVENGITKGTGDSKFSPEDTLNTAHIVTFLYRTMNPGKDGWSEEAALWAEQNGFLEGIDLTIDNDTPCPRGTVVEILYNILAK